MTVYRKCRPCKHRDNCEIKARLSEAIKGFGVGTISHRCRSYEPDLRPGDNVWIAAMAFPHSAADYGSSPPVAVFPGHFVKYSKTLGRAIVYIAPEATSRCGNHQFEPANGKSGFCKVSYAPYRAKRRWSNDKGIIDRREGRTTIKNCCGLPEGQKCDECSDAGYWF